MVGAECFACFHFSEAFAVLLGGREKWCGDGKATMATDTNVWGTGQRASRRSGRGMLKQRETAEFSGGI